MRVIADFHIHSPYSRAVSKEMTLENLHNWAGIKGISVMGTGDFTHPAWMKEIKAKLEPRENGLFGLKKNVEVPSATFPVKGKTAFDTRFILTVEISSIYSKNGKTRRVHNLVFAPSIETAEKINSALGWIGNLKSDGRPILGLDSKELAKIVFNTDPRAVLIPAHAWTPWFSVFGSMSGFDSLEECFDEYAKNIFAIETGLSSDPSMNWRLSMLDRIGLISNSDSHSLERIGREANVFDLSALSYDSLMAAIRAHDPKQFLYTVEFFPEEGKYHYDGHRVCKTRFTPEETSAHGNICPVCKKPVTVGVMNRVAKLADRPLGGKPNIVVPFKNLVQLDGIIGEAFDLGTGTKRVKEEYRKLIAGLGSEFFILIDASLADIKSVASPEVFEGIKRVKEGRLHIEPGYDGEYGVVKIFDPSERKEVVTQKSLF